jgi:NADH:ubiquinone oxidoreductase subunit 6 (subunit J)
MTQSKPISHIVAGAIIAAFLIILTIGMYLSHVDQAGIFAWLPYIIIIAGLILFINLYGNAHNNQLGFGNLFGYGFKTTAFTALIVILFTVIFLLAFPDVKEKSLEMARKKMEDRGNSTDEEIEKGMEMVRKLFWVFTIGGIILVYAIVGAIGSLIGAAITKKKKINPSEQLNF